MLKERTQELHEKLESLFQLFPQLDPKIVQGIGEAGKSMGSARIVSANWIRAARCRRSEPPSNDCPSRSSRCNPRCSKWLSAANSATCRSPACSAKGRFLPYGIADAASGHAAVSRVRLSKVVSAGLDTERFRLPGKEEYKAPRNFREEILESLKQGVPPQMKEQIERYFKNLSE